jgi:hypothetical protein
MPQAICGAGVAQSIYAIYATDSDIGTFRIREMEW